MGRSVPAACALASHLCQEEREREREREGGGKEREITVDKTERLVQHGECPRGESLSFGNVSERNPQANPEKDRKSPRGVKMIHSRRRCGKLGAREGRARKQVDARPVCLKHTHGAGGRGQE